MLMLGSKRQGLYRNFALLVLPSLLLSCSAIMEKAKAADAGSPTTSEGSAIEPDFYLMMEKCKTTVGYLVLSDQSLRLLEGDPATSACIRQAGTVLCYLSWGDGTPGHRGNVVEYQILADAPPLLILSDANGGEYISVNTTERAAVVVTRIASIEYAGSKVCHGLYATSFDLKGMQQ